MGALFERLCSSRLAESALITVCGVMASRREATKPIAISTAMAALAEEKVPQKEALVVECVVVQGGGAPQLPGAMVSVRTREDMVYSTCNRGR